MHKEPDKSLWTGRMDGKRVHHSVRFENGDTPTYALLGFASDAGVKRNQGREGAAFGPEAFRKAFANLPILKPLRLRDFGDIVCTDNLEEAQELFKTKIKELLNKGYTPFAIGGGHEISYPHYCALAETFPQLNIGIINFDAHLDLRSPLEGHLSTSGSSFYQIAKESKSFHYLCLGAQELSNTSELWDRLKALKGEHVLAEEMILNKEKALNRLTDFLKKVDKVYLTVCLDVFSQAYAPGVSAPNPLGLSPYDALPLLHEIKTSGKMLSFDIAELNPHFDRDGITAKLAAHIAMELL